LRQASTCLSASDVAEAICVPGIVGSGAALFQSFLEISQILRQVRRYDALGLEVILQRQRVCAFEFRGNAQRIEFMLAGPQLHAQPGGDHCKNSSACPGERGVQGKHSVRSWPTTLLVR